MPRPYENREIDAKIQTLMDKLDDNSHLTRNKIQAVQNVLELRIADDHKAVADSLSRIEVKQDAHGKKLDYTNGKVRKIIMAIIGLAGILIGLGFQQLMPFLTLLV
jgi:hypothetical protein